MIPLQVQAGPVVAPASGNVTLTFNAAPLSTDWAISVLVINGTRRASARATVLVDGTPQGITFGVPGQAGPLKVRARQALSISLTGLTAGDSITANAWGYRMESGDNPLALGEVAASGALQIVQALVAGTIDVPDTGLVGLHVDATGNLGIGGTSATVGTFLIDAATGNVTIGGTLGVTGAVTISSPSIVTVGTGTGQMILDPVNGLLTAGRFRMLRLGAAPSTPPASRIDLYGFLRGTRTILAAITDDGTKFDLTAGAASMATSFGSQGGLTNSVAFFEPAVGPFPGNLFQIGTMVRMFFHGLAVMPAAPPTITVGFDFGSGVFPITVQFTPEASVTRGFYAECLLYCVSTGAAGTLNARAKVEQQNATAAGQVNRFDNAAAATTYAFDTTVQRSFRMRFQMGAAVAAATTTIELGAYQFVATGAL